MDIILFSIILCFAIILFILAFIRNHAVLAIFSGIIFIIAGALAMNGLDYKSLTTINSTTPTMTYISYNYTSWTHNIIGSDLTYTSAIGFILLLFGLFMLIIGAMILFSGKAKFDFADDNSED